MSSGKLRRERSRSRERHSRKDGDKRSDAGVPELNEEEYDEEWEHEWDDINEIGRGGTKYHKPYVKNPNQKWRGRGQFNQFHQHRGQNRFNKWEHRNYSAGSDHGSDSGRRPGRPGRTIPDEENLEMPPGEEITNLKVKIQDGKRFAEPDEVDADSFEEIRNRPRFSRGRGARGYHGGGRDKWAQGNRYKRPAASDLVDCREVLNRRKRYLSDPEGDLREKIPKRDGDLGDLREVLDSREPNNMDLRDLIEAPDMSLMDEFTEDVVGEVDLEEDIRLRIRNEYYNDIRITAEDDRPVRHFENDFEPEPYEYGDDRGPIDIPLEDDILENVSPPHKEEWVQNKWHQQRGGSRERSFDRGWSGRNRHAEADWPRPHVPHGSPREERASRDRTPRLGGSPIRRSRDHSRNRSRERVRSPPGRIFRERSFERGIRQREPSWEKRCELVPARDRVSPEHERRGSFEEDRRASERKPMYERERGFAPSRSPGLGEMDRVPPILDARGRMRSPPREANRGRERNHGRMESTSPVPPRVMIGSMSQRSQERNDSIPSERSRAPGRERNRSVERGPTRGMKKERDASSGRVRNWNAGQEKDVAERVRTRTRSVSHERTRGFHDSQRKFEERKRGGVQEGTRNTRWGRSISQDRDRRDRENSSGRDRDRSPRWTGPRTPSAERFRTAGWNQSRSPGRNRERSPNSEHSRGRGRPTDQSRERSRGRDIEGRAREKDKIPSRPKDQDRREKTQDQPRRRDFEHLKTQDIQPGRPRESSSSSKPDQNRKREQEANSSKSSSRDRPRSQERRSAQDKPAKRTSEFLEEFKQRYIREIEKPDKSVRRDEFVGKQGRSDSVQDKKQGSGFNQSDSREWENIRDYQERRTAQPVVDLPFLDESRRPRQNSSRDDVKQQESRSSRNLSAPFLPRNQNDNRLSHSLKKDEPGNWQSQSTKQSFSHHEEERRHSSRWGSPGRREKPSSHFDSHKSTAHSSQSAANPHHSSSNGKPEDGHWQRSRDLPSHGESLWNKPRSDLSSKPSRDANTFRPVPAKSLLSPREVIFVRGLARDVSDMDVRKDISNCGLWAKDVRVVYDTDTGVSRGLAFVTFNSVDEATRWMDLRNGVLNLRPNNHAVMDYSNPVSKDWECVRCHTVNFKNRSACYQCNRSKDDCLDGWEETCPYPTNALLLRGLNPLTSTSDVTKALKGRMVAQARLDNVKMGVDEKGRPRSVCFVQLTSVVDSMSLHKSIVTEPLMIDNNLVMVAYCQLDKMPPMDSHPGQLHPGLSSMPTVVPPSIPISMRTILQQSNNIPVVTRSAPPAAGPPPVISAAPPAVAEEKPAVISAASIRSMLEGNYSEKDIPVLAQYCASAYAKNPQEQAAYVRYYTKLYREKLQKNQTGGK